VGHQHNIEEKWQAYETKINRNFGKIAGRFYIVFQMNKAKAISNFKEYQIEFGDQHASKKVDPETFCFWVNDFFAKQALFYICGLMSSQ